MQLWSAIRLRRHSDFGQGSTHQEVERLTATLVVPVLNHYHLLDRMLASVDTTFDEVIIIDNGDSNYSIPEHITNARLFTMPHNLGVAGSWNFAIQATPLSSFWLICNSDIVFEPDTLATIKAAGREDAIVLTKCSPPYSCFMVGWQVIDKIGLFDSNLYPAYCEDNVLEFRAKAHGVPILSCDVFVHHDNSSTIKEPRFREANDRTFGANVAYARDLMEREDATEQPWSISRRRSLDWN